MARRMDGLEGEQSAGDQAVRLVLRLHPPTTRPGNVSAHPPRPRILARLPIALLAPLLALSSRSHSALPTPQRLGSTAHAALARVISDSVYLHGARRYHLSHNIPCGPPVRKVPARDVSFSANIEPSFTFSAPPIPLPPFLLSPLSTAARQRRPGPVFILPGRTKKLQGMWSWCFGFRPSSSTTYKAEEEDS
jgi:hypothetical protein